MEEEVVGKIYDKRLTRRLLGYMKPYLAGVSAALALLAADVVLLVVDATTGVSPEEEELLERYDVYGAPTVLFFGRDGRERTELRQTGLVKPEEMLTILSKLR